MSAKRTLLCSLLALVSLVAAGRPSSANCTTLYYEQDIDHFSWAAPGGSAKTTFQQRYFVCDQHLNSAAPKAVFFYFGNEDDVTLYINNTGLMWENAASFGALLVFAEHR
jgi:lysosomal Pro-X carboxypeptidase